MAGFGVYLLQQNGENLTNKTQNRKYDLIFTENSINKRNYERQ